MEKEFIPYEQALALKELGFNEPCFGKYDIYGVFDHKLFYHNHNADTILNCSAPTFSQAFRWFREKYNLSGVIIPTITMYWTFKTMTVVESIIEVPPYKHVDANDYMTYEEAELACLRKLIEIVKNGK